MSPEKNFDHQNEDRLLFEVLNKEAPRDVDLIFLASTFLMMKYERRLCMAPGFRYVPPEFKEDSTFLDRAKVAFKAINFANSDLSGGVASKVIAKEIIEDSRSKNLFPTLDANDISLFLDRVEYVFEQNNFINMTECCDLYELPLEDFVPKAMLSVFTEMFWRSDEIEREYSVRWFGDPNNFDPEKKKTILRAIIENKIKDFQNKEPFNRIISKLPVYSETFNSQLSFDKPKLLEAKEEKF